MTAGLLLGGAMFVACAILGERNALWIPAIVMLVAGMANAVAGPLL